MLLIPEIQTVVILVPRTGSGSLLRAVTARYPKAMRIYRHMEADGIPLGYDRWPRVGVVRHPVERLWSLYKFLQDFDGDHDFDFIMAMRRSVERPFCDWVVNNEVPFTTPYDRALRGRYWPGFTVRHPLPENVKSQWLYLRPDLGTEVYRFGNLKPLWDRLDLPFLPRANATAPSDVPELTPAAAEHVGKVFAWDFQAVGAGVPHYV